jgi:hypothetical protein
MNSRLLLLLCSGVSQRRAAILLQLDRKTITQKFLFLARLAKHSRLEFLETLKKSQIVFTDLHFDEMESSEISKCLPVSIPLMVEAKTRRILGLRVGRMPSKGPLAAISLLKYGPRDDDRPEKARALFQELKPVISPAAVITSDRNHKYPAWLKPHFPGIQHRTVKGKRGCAGGQGELKKIGFDPLFSLNHTCAMFRANVNRLFRRTWCTTKRRDRLEAHMELYVWYHNEVLIQPKGQGKRLSALLA